METLSEFQLIRQYFSALGASRADVALGVGDDAALVDVGSGKLLAVCTDMLNGGVHFPADAPAAAVGHKALAVNLSDLAAMGAQPSWVLLALSLPSADAKWLDEFTAGFQALAQQAGVALIGGDTTRGPCSVTVTVLGQVVPEQVLRRSGAQVGDRVYVSGSLGDAAAGLELWLAGQRSGSAAVEALLSRLHYPSPRLALGAALGGLASAAIDVSDGLVADLGHILEQSGVGARVELERLPLSAPLRAQVDPAQALHLALAGGDDYELCFTVPAEQEGAMLQTAKQAAVDVTAIGVIEAEPGLRILNSAGQPVILQQTGYQHFVAKPS